MRFSQGSLIDLNGVDGDGTLVECGFLAAQHGLMGPHPYTSRATCPNSCILRSSETSIRVDGTIERVDLYREQDTVVVSAIGICVVRPFLARNASLSDRGKGIIIARACRCRNHAMRQEGINSLIIVRVVLQELVGKLLLTRGSSTKILALVSGLQDVFHIIVIFTILAIR